MTNSDKIREAAKQCIDRARQLDDFDMIVDGDSFKLLKQALALSDASPAIVGVEPVAWNVEELAQYLADLKLPEDPFGRKVILRIGVLTKLRAMGVTKGASAIEGMSEDDALAMAREWGAEMGHIKEFMVWARPRINAFYYRAAQAPQSSPAPVMSREQLKEVAKWWMQVQHHVNVDECAEGHSALRQFNDLIEFHQYVLSLSPAQGVMPQVDQLRKLVTDHLNWKMSFDPVTIQQIEEDLASRLSALLKEK